MSIVLYILLGLVAICAIMTIVILTTPISLRVEVSARSYLIAIQCLGYRKEFANGRTSSRFLFYKFKPKPDKPDKSKKRDKPEETARKPAKKKEARDVGLSFWIERRDVFIEVLIVVMKFVREVITSFTLRVHKAKLLIGDGDPALTGSVLGWATALKASWGA
ncbi:MAG TPA: hypothetical protein ENN07_01110, partial [candidate division Zixibacteria bacterium]|nr:hypothetical protein [candidate division Zixibacteria bacterium]